MSMIENKPQLHGKNRMDMPSILCCIMQGLRTLAIATRELDEQWVSDWDVRYQEAAALLEGRDEATEKDDRRSGA